MRHHGRQSGLTLTELVVTVAILAVLLGIAVPAAKRLTQSLQASAGAHGLINAALSNARAIAVRQQKYAGVRFQQAPDGRTYLVFIINDDAVKPYVPGNLGCMAAKGRKPIMLPEDTGVFDGLVKINYSNAIYTDDKWVDNDLDINTNQKWMDANTFSILFSPAGKLVQHTLRVGSSNANDSVFNTPANVLSQTNPIGLLIEDGNPTEGLDHLELSRTSFVIYSKSDLAAVNAANRWTAYLSKLNTLRISPYTGELIGE
jgi:prepilin-type N-terminal cleavage/methylation domain-containing protein